MPYHLCSLMRADIYADMGDEANARAQYEAARALLVDSRRPAHIGVADEVLGQVGELDEAFERAAGRQAGPLG